VLALTARDAAALSFEAIKSKTRGKEGIMGGAVFACKGLCKRTLNVRREKSASTRFPGYCKTCAAIASEKRKEALSRCEPHVLDGVVNPEHA